MAKIMTIRMWILVVFLAFSILAINPAPWAEGVQVKNVKGGSPLAEAGLRNGEIIKSINRVEIKSLEDFKKEIEKIKFELVSLKVETDKGTFTHTFLGDPGFIYDNLTIKAVNIESELEQGMFIKKINNKKIEKDEDIDKIIKDLITKEKFILDTDKGSYAILISAPPQIGVSLAEKTNIKKGLDLQGGTRVLLRPISENQTITNKNVQDIIKVLSNRLNVYGLSDLKIRAANDLTGNKFILIEIAGVSKEEVKDLIAKQGKFEAKIGDDVVFIGGKGDIPFVCRDDGSCSGIRPPCNQVAGDRWSCTFQFAITLTEEAAKRHAEITDKLEINLSNTGDYLSKTIDFYLDDQMVDSLQIGADLKGRETTQIAISGPGFGPTEQAAYEDAITQMNKLQTILITGSLPLKLQIEKLDTISPLLGKEFIKNSIFVGILAIISVSLVVFLRYRKFKIVIPMIITSLSEILIILGVAAFIKWNLDLAAIAGIIAAVGTGVDHQIVITDEVLKSREYLNWKEKIKRAFFIIMVAYATTVAAMIPLWNAGAGLIRGFAVTTIIGVTVGVFVTRPAFASMIERLLEK